jgi:hypothetical protein
MKPLLQLRDPTTGEWVPIRALIGPPGPKGPKPEVGIDYFTEEDKDEIISRLSDTIEELMDNLYYKPGDSVRVHFHTTGVLTSDRKRIYFALPLDKPLKGVKKLEFQDPTGQVRQNAVYLLGSGSATDGWKWSNNLSITCDPTDFPMSLSIGYASDSEHYFNGINNETIGISLDCTIKFS